MPLYKYDDIEPIYNKYVKKKNDKDLLNSTLYKITVAEEENDDLNTLLSKKEKTLKDIGDIKYYVENLINIDVGKLLLVRHVIEIFISKNIKPNKKN